MNKLNIIILVFFACLALLQTIPDIDTNALIKQKKNSRHSSFQREDTAIIKLKPKSYYDSITTASLFHANRNPKLDISYSKQSVEGLSKSLNKLSLSAIITNNHIKQAIFYDVNSSKTIRVKIGSKIDRWTVTHIGTHVVTIENNNQNLNFEIRK